MSIRIATAILCLLFSIEAKDYPLLLECPSNYVAENAQQIEDLIARLLPENPVIFEIGAYEGMHTKELAARYPNSHIYSFEPNPRAFSVLATNIVDMPQVLAVNMAAGTINGTVPLYLCRGVYCEDLNMEKHSSLLDGHATAGDPFKGPSIDVPCTLLDTWCQNNNVDHIDYLILDTEGYELQIVKSSPHILKTARVITTKTYLYPFRKFTTKYENLRKFLESKGFVLIAHACRSELCGEATFIHQSVYDVLLNQ
jgi:FkbM family methyltransferase